MADRVRTALDFEFVPASVDLLESGLAMYRQRPDKSWSITDCTSFVIMGQRKLVQALAHDEHFVQAGFDALLRRETPV